MRFVRRKTWLILRENVECLRENSVADGEAAGLERVVWGRRGPVEEGRQDRAGGRWEGEDGHEVAGLAGALGSRALIRAQRPAPPCKISAPRLPEQASPGSRSLGPPPDFFCLGLTRGLWFSYQSFLRAWVFSEDSILEFPLENIERKMWIPHKKWKLALWIPHQRR